MNVVEKASRGPKPRGFLKAKGKYVPIPEERINVLLSCALSGWWQTSNNKTPTTKLILLNILFGIFPLLKRYYIDAQDLAIILNGSILLLLKLSVFLCNFPLLITGFKLLDINMIQKSSVFAARLSA
ncbi:MAG: hypothetical protein ACQETE_04230 [Bacteroidota bacterium]